MSGFSNSPKILKGALVKYAISIPPLIVSFQFNPVTISKDRSNTFSVPGWIQELYEEEGRRRINLREFHHMFTDLRGGKILKVRSESNFRKNKKG